MKHTASRFIVVVLICLTFAAASAAQMGERDMAKEEKIWQQLQQTAPKAVETFKAATVALDEQKYQESAELYNKVLSQSPTNEAAMRRLSFALVGMGKRAEGLKASEAALDFNRTPDNLIGLAMNLTSPGANNYKPTKAELEKAFALSKEAMQKDTENDSDYPVMVAQLALATNRMEDFRDVSLKLNSKFPESPATHYFNGIRLADAGDLDAAEAEVVKAQNLGMPPAAAQELLKAIQTEKDNSYYWIWKYFYYGLYLVGAWILGLIVLFVAGKILSSKTLRSIENSDPNDVTGGGQAGLRKFYKNVIGIAGVYYYLSQPVVMMLVLVVAGGITFFFLWLGRIPIKLVLIVGFVALATVFYMIKSLLVRTKVEDPGRALSESEAPELWALVRDVAAAINTRPVNEIRVTHGTELAVYERGGMRVKMQDQAERILIVGVATLNGFSQNAFRAVLAHEYGHFSNRDTAGGDIAYRVNLDIIRLAESMALSGTATVYNIAFQFLRVYHFIFRRITHGATRLQEILADRVAVHQYGADAFREGLTHVIRRDIEFNHVADKEINAALSSNRALQNLYEMTEQNEEIKKDLEQMYHENIARPTTEDDTHPSPNDRFKWASQIKSRETAPISGMVWDLFKNRETLTNEMNALLESRIKAMM
jgi:Zn-dependent protease with chaperone function/tetratricopeptide (TPR) repeat protein